MNETVPTTTEDALPQETTAPEPSTRRWGTVLVWGAIIAVLVVLGWGLLNARTTRPEPGAAAPSFEMQFFDGYGWNDLSAATLEDMRGNVIVLNFWASWCVECRYEADLLESAWREYGDQGVIFLGVTHYDVESKSLAYLREFDITYPNAPDLGAAIAQQYEITGVPETFFIDREGNVTRTVIGPVDDGVLHAQIAQLLSQ